MDGLMDEWMRDIMSALVCVSLPVRISGIAVNDHAPLHNMYLQGCETSHAVTSVHAFGEHAPKHWSFLCFLSVQHSLQNERQSFTPLPDCPTVPEIAVQTAGFRTNCFAASARLKRGHDIYSTK